MDINHYMKIQNAYGTENAREADLINVNAEMRDHFEDTFDTESVTINGDRRKLMIVKDTDNNVFKKKIKGIHGEAFNLGDYVIWNNQIWLITLIDPDTKTWHRGYMYLCTVPLRWQNSNGDIVERWGYSEDFTKYSSGISANEKNTMPDNQYGITVPIDTETKKLKRDRRFAIDFDDAEEPEIYRLTNRKVMLNNNEYFGRGGTMILTMSVDLFNKSADKKADMPDGGSVWVCNYKECESPENDDKIPVLSGNIKCEISGGDSLKIGFKKTYIAKLSDEGGKEVLWSDKYSWNVESDFEIQSKISGEKIEIKIDDEYAVGSIVKLQIISKEAVISEREINITGLFV